MTVPQAAPAGEQDVDGPDAEERAGAEARLRLRRGRLATAVVVAVVVALVAAVALLGGFRVRQDRFTAVAVGAVIATGPYEVTVDQATVQRDGSGEGWRVEVSGTARTTGDTSIDPETGDDGFVFARADATREVQASRAIALGPSDPGFEIDYLAPGLPPVPWRVSFTFASDPGDAVLVVVFDQEYTKPWIFGDEMGWRPTDHGSRLTLPLQR